MERVSTILVLSPISCLVLEGSRSTHTPRQPVEIPRGPGGQQPRERHSSHRSRSRDDEYDDDDDYEDGDDDDFYDGGSLPSAANM